MLTNFNYWLTGYGWAEVFFTSDTQSTRFEFSYLSDPLAGLIESLLDLLERSRDRARIEFFDEPGCYHLIFTKLGGELKVEIRSDMEVEGAADTPADWAARNPIFETLDSIENVCAVINAGIIDLRRRHTESEYLEQWVNYPFPIDHYKKLEHALSTIH